jgi:[ribosomal protein S5]-alanine N-acetyltransferase
MKTRIESERLVLISLDTTDTEQFFDFLVRNKDYFRKWSAEYEQNYFSIWFHRAWLESIEQEALNGTQIKFGVYYKTNPNRIIGSVSFSNIIKGIFQSCFLGYRIDEFETRKGIATEAIKRGIEYVFSELKLHRIEANVMPSNAASIKVVEKLGFSNEGLAKKYLKVNGKWEDHYHYVLLNKNIE